MTTKKTIAFITKYALSAGIKEAKGEVDGDRFRPDSGEFYYSSFGIGKEVFLTREDALKNCELRRQKKIKSMEKQIKAIGLLKF